MREPEGTRHPSADPHPGRRGRSGVGSLLIMLAIAAVALIAFLLYDGGWNNPPDETVTAEGESAETEAPSGTETPEPLTPGAAAPNAPVETDPPAQGN